MRGLRTAVARPAPIPGMDVAVNREDALRWEGNAFRRWSFAPSMGLRERWRAGRPEFVVLAGSAIGFGGNVAWLGGVLLSRSEVPGPTLFAVTTAALVLCVLVPLPLRRAHPP